MKYEALNLVAELLMMEGDGERADQGKGLRKVLIEAGRCTT